MIQLTKSRPSTVLWEPLESGTIALPDGVAGTVFIHDPLGRVYFEKEMAPGRTSTFRARGMAGMHTVHLVGRAGTGDDDEILAVEMFRLAPKTRIESEQGCYGRLARRLQQLIISSSSKPTQVSEQLYHWFVPWLRDHVYVLKSQKYFAWDIRSGFEFYWERQQPNGMIWDTIDSNRAAPMPNILGEALGQPFNTYEQDRAWIIRRIPCEADVEYLAIEGLHHIWKATGDDAWLRQQIPAARKALHYMMSDPLRWSEKNKLVKRVYTMDSWDFTNPHFYPNIDHRWAPESGPFFHLHSDNSGCYAAMVKLAEMLEAVGDSDGAAVLERQAEQFRTRANRKLFHDPCYAHMVPEKPMRSLVKLVGDDTKRLSLSVGYTLNRGLPTHEMAVKVLREYQRRRKAQAKSSYAEWWTMDPMYTPEQWPTHVAGSAMPQGEYMNGAISPIVAGELARAAFEHGEEAYGADILRRVWDLSERDQGGLNDAYRRLPSDYQFKNPGKFTPIDLKGVTNAGLRHKAHRNVQAWTGEGDNDMRNLPTGRQILAGASFTIIDPGSNSGRAILGLSTNPARNFPPSQEIPIPGRKKAASLYFLHAGAPGGQQVAGLFDILYADGTEHRTYIRMGTEIGHWWGPEPLGGSRAPSHVARIGWRGPNPTFGNVGVFVFALNNPRPDQELKAIRLTAVNGSTLLVAALSLSSAPGAFDLGLRSYGAPANWAQSSVYHAVAEGLAGVVDTGRAFSSVRISPRWAITESGRAECCLHYPSSDGYVTYHYRHDPTRRRMDLEITGSFEEATIHCLMPKGKEPIEVLVNGQAVPFEVVRVEQSIYADFDLPDLPIGPIEIRYR